MNNIENDFVPIPNFNNYRINKNGQVKSLISGKILNPTLIDGYYTFPLRRDDGTKRFIRRSRLLCMTFKPVEDMDLLMIDHINCDKTDDRLTNLEWVTAKENSQRAAKNGLMGKRVSVTVYDVITKTATQYPTKAAAARACKISLTALEYRLTSIPGRIYPELKSYSYTDRELIISEKEHRDCELFLYGNQKSVFLRKLDTGDIVECESLSHAAKMLDLPLSTLSMWIHHSESKQPVLPGLIQLKFVNDSRDWITPENPWLELQHTIGRRPVKVTNTRTGEIRIYSTLSACARDNDCKKTTLSARLNRRNKDNIYPDGKKYEWYDNSVL